MLLEKWIGYIPVELHKYSSLHNRRYAVFPSIFWVVRDNLPTDTSTVDSSKHKDAVTLNLAQKEKMKSYADVKWRTKSTELKERDDNLVKHTGTKDKLISYWANDLFTVVRMNRPVVIILSKRDGKVFARKNLMFKKCKNIIWLGWTFRHR